MRTIDINAIYPKRNLSKLGKAKYIHPYLLRNLKITRRNQVWAIDISYIPMEKGFMYLTAVIDLYSRYLALRLFICTGHYSLVKMYYKVSFYF